MDCRVKPGNDAESNAAALAALPATALLVNVARGDLIDGVALAAPLAEGRLGCAALDVAEAEPLAPASPLWDLPNTIITPHVAGRFVRLFATENLVWPESYPLPGRGAAAQYLPQYGQDVSIERA